MTNKGKPSDEAKAKFLAAIEAKKKKNAAPTSGRSAGSKVSGGQATGGAPGRFQRKSGSSGSAAG